jgi:hypothetical protein
LAFAGWLAIDRLGSARTSALAAFTTTIWVVDWIHGSTTNGWSDSKPAAAASFTEIDQAIFFI